MSYPYLVSTLPMLGIDKQPPMSLEAFVELCQEQLSNADFQELEALLSEDEQPTNNSFIKEWRAAETQLRNAVARARAAKLDGVDANKWLRTHSGFDVVLENGVISAFQERDPALRQKVLDQLLWDKATELAGYDEFSLKAIFAYAIQLKICNVRSSQTDSEKGATRLTAVASGNKQIYFKIIGEI